MEFTRTNGMKNWNTTNLVILANTVRSTTVFLQREIEHLKVVFTGINQNPVETMNRMVNQEPQWRYTKSSNNVTIQWKAR